MRNMKTIGVIVSFLTLIIVSPVVSGFVALKFYGWFVLPHFDLPELGIAAMIGLVLFIRFIVFTSSFGEEDNDDIDADEFGDVIAKSFLKVFVKAGLLLLVGWIISLFI